MLATHGKVSLVENWRPVQVRACVGGKPEYMGLNGRGAPICCPTTRSRSEPVSQPSIQPMPNDWASPGPRTDWASFAGRVKFRPERSRLKRKSGVYAREPGNGPAGVLRSRRLCARWPARGRPDWPPPGGDGRRFPSSAAHSNPSSRLTTLLTPTHPFSPFTPQGSGWPRTLPALARRTSARGQSSRPAGYLGRPARGGRR